MKKAIVPIILTAIALLLSGCVKPWEPQNTPKTAETEKPQAVISISDLADYSIVYPSAYSQAQMNIIYLLQSVLQKATGSEIPLKSDNDKVTSKEIVIASSKRTTEFEWDLQDISGELDYVIAAGQTELVIGGNNYLGDVKAVYDFIRNYADYDIATETFGTERKTASGYEYFAYKKADFLITAVNYRSKPIEDYKTLAEMKSLGFNAVLIDMSEYSREQLEALLFNAYVCDIQVIMRGVAFCDLCAESHIVVGHVLAEEPYEAYSFTYYSSEVRVYDAAYSEFGWKSYVLMMSQLDAVEMYAQNGEFFDKLSRLLLIWKPESETQNIIRIHEILANATAANGTHLSAYIDTDTANYEWTAGFSLCFGADGVYYFNYASPKDSEESFLADNEYNITEKAALASSANKNIAKTAEILSQYSYIGTTVFGESELGAMETPYSADIAILGEDSFLVGCYENQNGAAYVITEASLPTGNTDMKILEISLDADEITVTTDGRTETLQKNESGTFTIEFNAGQIVTVTE